MPADRTCSPRRLIALLASLLVVAVVSVLPSAGAGAAPALTKPPVPAEGAYFGASASVHNGETRQQAIERTETQLGRRLDIDHQFYTWDQSLVNAVQHADAAAGRYPFVSWKPRRNNGQIVTWASVANGTEDAHIRATARQLRDFAHPMFATFHHEPYDETTKGWGTAADFRAAFRHVVELFRDEGAHNVAWVLVLTSWDYSQGRGDTFYPGADVIDWIAADPYNFHQRDGRWHTLETVARDFYDWGSRTGKPLMLAEWGSTEDPHDPARKATWVDQATTTLRAWPNIRAAVYFNNLHTGYDWRIDTSPASLHAFRRLANDPHFTPRAARTPSGTLEHCPSGDDRFADVGPHNPHGDNIDCAVAYGVVDGTSPTTFDPTGDVTRGQAAAFVARALRAAGVDLAPAGDGFDDTDGDVHEPDIRRLDAAGVLGGFPDGTFRPAATITRGQFATMLVRAHDLAGPAPLASPGVHLFSDIDGDVHAGSIDRAARAGIVTGTGPMTYSPADATSRAQAAAVLVRLLRQLSGEGVAVAPA